MIWCVVEANLVGTGNMTHPSNPFTNREIIGVPRRTSRNATSLFLSVRAWPRSAPTASPTFPEMFTPGACQNCSRRATRFVPPQYQFKALRNEFLNLALACAQVKPEDDPAYMLNVISSAIVNTPPPPGMITMLNKLASKTHKTLRKDHIDERMMELFKEDTDGSKLKNTRIMGRRNYCIVDYQEDGALRFDMRMEVSQGEGTTKGYSAFAPAVKY